MYIWSILVCYCFAISLMRSRRQALSHWLLSLNDAVQTLWLYHAYHAYNVDTFFRNWNILTIDNKVQL